MSVSPERASTSEYLPPVLSNQPDSGTLGLGQRRWMVRHQFDDIYWTCCHIVRESDDVGN